MIVVDASALANMLVYDGERGRAARTVLTRDPAWAAPEHWKAELFSVLRGLSLAGKLSLDRAEWAVARIPRLGVEHVPLDGLLPRMWQLRDNISSYDAAYVALAEQRALTLVTSDTRLARTATGVCCVELVGVTAP
ncbi:type II toxin-antitoxin system VapC family toxin [Pseudonocardia asaccharolytica]|uniref:Ribonuclease VapC n=1 Tax=Pseudonocardia asaccharolytica DSM 44247 = NBRC 16224 TaxID=1123024 RepID=A0A511CW94_9PSEU|nr:type II toxin-antitoxin system VapC family toxin [Pseudonocardia asaccharolytica]GEL16513.1 ribonuclease VapC9 [Pseudonocardia asaccharolytica DSM 44247 = NBRC 16224]